MTIFLLIYTHIGLFWAGMYIGSKSAQIDSSQSRTKLRWSGLDVISAMIIVLLWPIISILVILDGGYKNIM